MDAALIGAIAGPLIGVVGPILVWRVNSRSTTTDAAQNQINQIQEDRDADRAQFIQVMARMQGEVDRANAKTDRALERIEVLEADKKISNDYILTLRYWIAEEKKPPPPPFPAELTRGMANDR